MLLERTATSPCLLPADGPSVGAELEVAFVDPLSNPQWNRWVQSHPDGSVFHTSAWAKVLVKTYGHKPFYLRFSRGRQTVALIPLMEVSSFLTGRRAVCVPFSDSCAPLIFDTDAAPAIMEALSRLASEKKWRHVELRGPVRTDGAAPSTEFLGHTLAITDDSEALFSRFSSANRGAIRKAQKSGVTSHISTSRDAIRDFYRLHTVTRKRHGVPPQPLSFFLNIHEEIIKKGMGFVVTAWNDTTAIAANRLFPIC
jgi:lipid II:glycine glycyltransferase (peptidoglycan interpeptide bridge formation enzyme)